MVLHKHFLKILLKMSPYFIGGIILLLLVDYMQLDIPIRIGEIVNIFKNAHENNLSTKDIAGNYISFRDTIIFDNANNKTMIPIILRLLLVVAIICIGRIIWRFYIFGGSRAVERDIRNKMFTHATNLSQDYYSQNKVGAIMSLFTADLDALRNTYGPGTMQLIDGSFLLLMVFYRMFRMNLRLTLFSFIPLSAVLILMVVYKASLKYYFGIKQKSLENMSNFVQESFSGISIIKAHVKEMFELSRFREKRMDLFQKSVIYATTLRRFLTLLTLSSSLTFIIIIGYSSYIVSTGVLTAGEVVTYLTYFMSLTWPMNALGTYLSTLTQGSASAKRIVAFLNQPIDVKDNKEVVANNILDGTIRLNHLTFSYPDDKDRIILSDVTFEIKNGEQVGILGRTGSGKTTLMELLLRLYNVKEDTLFIGGKDVTKIPIKEVRNIIGYVPQDNFLFSTSIKNNIAFASPNTKINVIEAAKLSAVYNNIINFPQGFDTVLGERGVTISGGQKQRISIARALAKKPKILILDDSVSAVDTETESEILDNFAKIKHHQTTIFIAHRISTVKNLDKIIIFNNGQIEAIGNHTQLLKESPYYQELVRKQELESELNG